MKILYNGKKLCIEKTCTHMKNASAKCRNEKDDDERPRVSKESDEKEEEDDKESSVKEKEEKEEKQEDDSDKDKEETKEEVSGNDKEEVILPEILSLVQTYSTRYEWQDDIWLLYSEYSNVTMWEEAEKYSKMDRVLSEKVGMQTRTMEDEADNILSFITDMGMLEGDLQEFATQVSTSDVQVRRADSVVLSYVTDSYADYGFIEDFRSV